MCMALYTVDARAFKDSVLISTCSIVHDISLSASMHLCIITSLILKRPCSNKIGALMRAELYGPWHLPQESA